MKLLFSNFLSKDEIFTTVAGWLTGKGFSIANKDENKPWGGYFVIDEQQSEKFIKEFFSSFKIDELLLGNKLSPKLLIVQPNKRLSWQYHHRRAEIWKVVEGEVGIISSDTDNETGIKTYKPGSVIQLKQGERHRLIGLKNWGVVAEIWQHTDIDNPSNEEDIIRLQDDFKR